MVAGLVLAAGAGRRFGRPKALVEYRGELLVERAIRTLTEAGCVPVLVVLGAAHPTVPLAAEVVDNPAWASGMASSLRAGLTRLSTTDCTAVVILPVDTPGITSAAVRRLTALATPHALARATYDGEPGHPVLIGSAHWPPVIAQAVGDSGARSYLAHHPVTPVECSDIASGTDADTPADLP